MVQSQASPSSSETRHGVASDLLHYLDNVLIIKHMVFANLLGSVLHAETPHQGVLELLHDALVYPVAEVFDSSSAFGQNNRIVIVWQFTLQQSSSDWQGCACTLTCAMVKHCTLVTPPVIVTCLDYLLQTLKGNLLYLTTTPDIQVACMDSAEAT